MSWQKRLKKQGEKLHFQTFMVRTADSMFAWNTILSRFNFQMFMYNRSHYWPKIKRNVIIIGWKLRIHLHWRRRWRIQPDNNLAYDIPKRLKECCLHHIFKIRCTKDTYPCDMVSIQRIWRMSRWRWNKCPLAPAASCWWKNTHIEEHKPEKTSLLSCLILDGKLG